MRRAVAAAALTALTIGCAAPAMQTESSSIERGRYLVTIMDCGGCHDTGALAGRSTSPGAMAGSDVGFDLPGLGVFYPPNLTPHADAGLGRWSEGEIVTALRTGARPDGRRLAPVMPWPSYASLTDADAGAIAAYLKSLPPSAHRSPGPATVATATAPYHGMVVPGATSRQADPR